MLFRGSNAVGYSNYPDNVVRGFVKHSAEAGMDIFRVFDSLNYTPNLKAAMEAVRETHAVCEGTICYSGDILDESRTKYTLKYYVDLAKELVEMGAHMICIKDMAGLCRPYAANKLVKTCARRSACRSTSTPTTPPGSTRRRSSRLPTPGSISPTRPSPRCRARPRSRT